MSDGDKRQTRGLFVTGTDTGVGKTYVTALLAQRLVADGFCVGAYKPACSGCVDGPHGVPVWEDVERLSQAIGGNADADRICPQRFSAPLAPPAAARAEDRAVDADLLRSGAADWFGRVDILLVEGVGGLLCPLTEEEAVADLAVDLGAPLLIVCRGGLGTINHTLLTVEAAKTRGLTVAGVVLNSPELRQCDAASANNAAEITARCGVPVLARLACDAPLGLPPEAVGTKMDWGRLCGGFRLPQRPPPLKKRVLEQ